MSEERAISYDFSTLDGLPASVTAVEDDMTALNTSMTSALASLTDTGTIDSRVVLTQTEYDALVTKSATTEYIIVG